VSNGDHVEYVRHEHGEPIPADMKLFGIVSLGQDSPFLRQLMAIDVGELGDLPHVREKLSLEKFEYSIAPELIHDNRGGEIPASRLAFDVALFSREINDPIDKRGLGLSVAFPVEMKVTSQLALERFVLGCNRRMRAKVIPEGNGIKPLTTAERHQMQMVSAKHRRRFAKPVF
jgi:hypothetical protein